MIIALCYLCCKGNPLKRIQTKLKGGMAQSTTNGGCTNARLFNATLGHHSTKKQFAPKIETKTRYQFCA